ncbi:MAG: RNA ligase family protein [bacterium]
METDLFQKYIKYPRTYHLPWSNVSNDDKLLKDDTHFFNKRVICTLKMDGENTTMYNDYFHARSLDSNNHESRNWVKGLWSRISYLLDDNMRICGENLYAVHSLKYDNLKSYFMMFSIWIDNKCLSWD